MPKVRKLLFLIVQFSQSCRCSKPLRNNDHSQRRSHTYPSLLKNKNYLHMRFDLIVCICFMHVKFLLTSPLQCEWHSWIIYVTNTSCELLLVIMCKCLTHNVVAEPSGSAPLITKPTPGHIPVPFSPTSHLHRLTSHDPSQYYPLISCWVSWANTYLDIFPPIFCFHLLSPPSQLHCVLP